MTTRPLDLHSHPRHHWADDTSATCQRTEKRGNQMKRWRR